MARPLSFQLYSARFEPSLAQTVEMLAGLGYQAVEPFGALIRNRTDELAGLLARHAMRAPSAHIGLDWLREDRAAAFSACRRVGVETVFAPAPPQDERDKDEAGWRALGRELAEFCRHAAGEGFRFGWHNHHWEYGRAAGGATFLEAMFEEAPDLVWQADLAWTIRGGGDPLAEIARHGKRLVSCHFKDIAPAGECADEDGWADPGHGIMDWRGIAAALRSSGDVLFVAEHDRPNDAARFARRALETYRTLV